MLYYYEFLQVYECWNLVYAMKDEDDNTLLEIIRMLWWLWAISFVLIIILIYNAIGG
jgi:hypothetical protein